MNQKTTNSQTDEDVLARFVSDLEQSKNVAKLVAVYSERNPHMAEQLAQIARMMGTLEDLRSRPLDPVPTRLGEFRILRELFGGGMGRVYEAIQEPLGRRVAVKTIRGDRLSPQMRARFLREQTVLASLHQTHIVPIHTAGQSGDLQYFAMPFIEGVTLHQIIDTVQRQQSTSPNVRTPTLAQLASHHLGSTKQIRGDATQTLPTGDAIKVACLPPEKTSLSMAYFRSVAMVMRDAAEAFHHVHGLQILHRDLKPSNLMVDTAGQCWIIDFGLAAYLYDSEQSRESDVEGSPGLSEQIRRRLTLGEGDGLGTPAYMAPEQWQKETGDARTDVWGLGVTLYEMLTLRQAFPGEAHEEIRRKVESDDPLPPRQFVKRVPRELDAICRKALKKDPAARYQTAQEFAADLKRWLNHEPVKAQPTRVPRRVALWARRNRGWAAAIIVFFLACAGLAAGEFRSVQNRAIVAEAQEREEHREEMLLRMHDVRQVPHHTLIGKSDWLDDGWSLVRQAAQIRRDDALRDQAAAFLAGISARLTKQMVGFKASAVAFGAADRYLLIGGSDEDEAKIWDSTTDEFQQSGLAGGGPVTFRTDGTAWQLVATKKDRFPLLLWDVGKRRLVRELSLPKPLTDGSLDELNVSEIVMTPGGGFAGALSKRKGAVALMTVWDTSNGRVVRQTSRDVTTLALSGDGDFLAAGDAHGQVVIWPLAGGEPVLLPSARRTRLNCLAFGRNPRGRAGNDKTDRWLLAGGDSGGAVIIWDLGRAAVRAYCQGSYFDVYTLTFSPDGVTLASSGRNATRLWDVATGRALLNIQHGDFMTGLAFGAEARRIAVSMAPDRHFDPSRQAIHVWDLEYHRGIQSLCGLDSQIAHSKTCFTRDGSRIAAISLAWQAAIWDLPSGSLRYLFDMAPGLTADNAGLAFSHDGRKFAVSGGSEARMWDLESGRVTAWQLPEGLVDTLAFDATGTKLFLFRMETADWIHAPNSSSPTRLYPRVCRVRDLLASPQRDLRRPGKGNPAWETGFFNAGVFIVKASPDGRFFVAAGARGFDKTEHLLKVFDCATGKDLLSIGASAFHLDATGNLLQFTANDSPGQFPLIEIPSGKWIGSLNPPASALGPGAHFLANEHPERFGHTLYRRGDETPLVSLGIDTLSAEGHATFSLDGTRLAWGNQDGTVTVCYLAEVQRRLASIGFGW